MNKKIFTVLLALALVVTVAGSGAAQSSPGRPFDDSAATPKPSAEDMGRMVGLYLSLMDTSDKIDGLSRAELAEWAPDVLGKLKKNVVSYLRDNVQKPSTGSQRALEAVDMFLNYDGKSAGALRQDVYEKLGKPWPQYRYENWGSFYDGFIGAFDNSEVIRESSSAEMGRLSGLFAALRSSWYPRHQRNQLNNVKSYLNYEVGGYLYHNVVNHNYWKAVSAGSNSWEYMITGVQDGIFSRGDIYRELGKPWPKSRYDNWVEFYRAFMEVIG